MRHGLERIASIVLVLLIVAIGVGSGAQFGLVVAAIVVLVVVHELGHAVIGSWGGFAVLDVRVGSGPVLARFHVGETRFEAHLFPFDGAVSVVTTEWRRLRRRVAFLALAGVGAAFTVAGVVAVFAPDPVRIALAWACVLQLANLAVPEVKVGDRTIESDGGLFGRALFGPRPWLEERFVAAGLRARYLDELTRDDAEAALSTAVLVGRLFPGDSDGRVLAMYARCRLGEEPDIDALAKMKWITRDPHAAATRAYCTSGIAYHVLVRGRFQPELITLLRRARQESPTQPGIAATLSWALIEHGDVTEGLRISGDALQEDTTGDQRAVVLAIRALGLIRARERDEARAVRARAADLDPTCAVLPLVDAELDRAEH